MNLVLGPWVYTMGMLIAGFCGIMLMRLARSRPLKIAIMMGTFIVMVALMLSGMRA